MPVLEIIITAKLDGKILEQFGLPLRHRQTVDEVQAIGPYTKADDADDTTFSTIPSQQIATIQALLLKPDAEMDLRINGQSDARLTVGADGFILLGNVTINDGAATNVTANANGVTPNVSGFAAGT